MRSRLSTLHNRDPISPQVRLVLAVQPMPLQVELWLSWRSKATMIGLLMNYCWVVWWWLTYWQDPRYVLLMLGLYRGPNLTYLSPIYLSIFQKPTCKTIIQITITGKINSTIVF